MPRQSEPVEIPKLSELEWVIMKPFWDEGPMAARDIYARVGTQQKWAYKTVKTMLARLVQKGALSYEQIGNSYLYKAAFTRQAMTRSATGAFVQRVFDGAMSPFFAYFAERATPEELAVIRRELARIESKSDTTTGGKGRGTD